MTEEQNCEGRNSSRREIEKRDETDTRTTEGDKEQNDKG
jgi:hypothetical protein